MEKAIPQFAHVQQVGKTFRAATECATEAEIVDAVMDAWSLQTVDEIAEWVTTFCLHWKAGRVTPANVGEYAAELMEAGAGVGMAVEFYGQLAKRYEGTKEPEEVQRPTAIAS